MVNWVIFLPCSLKHFRRPRIFVVTARFRLITRHIAVQIIQNRVRFFGAPFSSQGHSFFYRRFALVSTVLPHVNFSRRGCFAAGRRITVLGCGGGGTATLSDRRKNYFLPSKARRPDHAVTGNGITSVCFVTAGAKLTRCAWAMLCSRRKWP